MLLARRQQVGVLPPSPDSIRLRHIVFCRVQACLAGEFEQQGGCFSVTLDQRLGEAGRNGLLGARVVPPLRRPAGAQGQFKHLRRVFNKAHRCVDDARHVHQQTAVNVAAVEAQQLVVAREPTGDDPLDIFKAGLTALKRLGKSVVRR